MTRRRSFLSVSVFYAGFFTLLATQIAYWPLWLESRGLSEAEIGWAAAGGVLIRAVSGVLLPWLADLWGRPRAVLAAVCLGGTVLLAVQVAAADKPTLVVAFLLATAAMGAAMPLGEHMGYAAALRTGFAYGRARSIGSAAFIACNLAGAALIETAGLNAVVWLALAGFFAAGLAALAYPSERALRKPPRLRDAVKWFVSAPQFLAFAVAMALIHASHGVLYAYGSLYWAAAGASEMTIGGLWAAGVVFEILLFIAADRLPKITPRTLGLVAAAAGVIRFVGFALGPPIWVFWGLQILHAFSFGAAHLAIMRMIAATAPEGLRATAQGLSTAGLGGLAATAAGAMAAMLYPWAPWAAFAAAAATAALGGAALLISPSAPKPQSVGAI